MNTMYGAPQLICDADHLDWEVVKYFSEARAALQTSRKRKKDYIKFLNAVDICCFQAATNSIDRSAARYIFKYGVMPIIEDDSKIRKYNIQIMDYPYILKIMEDSTEKKQEEKVSNELTNVMFGQPVKQDKRDESILDVVENKLP